jgi:hypothetical protein
VFHTHINTMTSILTDTNKGGWHKRREIYINGICFRLKVTNSLKLTGSQGHVTADAEKCQKLDHYCSCQLVQCVQPYLSSCVQNIQLRCFTINDCLLLVRILYSKVKYNNLIILLKCRVSSLVISNGTFLIRLKNFSRFYVVLIFIYFSKNITLFLIS